MEFENLNVLQKTNDTFFNDVIEISLMLDY